MDNNRLHPFQRVMTLAGAVALTAAGCGSGSDGVVERAAQVEVEGVQQGCADLIEVGSVLSKSSDGQMSVDDLAVMGENVRRARQSFSDAPDDAQRYLELLDKVFSATVGEVASRGDVDSAQIALLLSVEFLAANDDVGQLGPDASNYFEETCDTALFAGQVDLSADDVDASGDNVVASGDPAPSSTLVTTSTLAPPDPVLAVDGSSLGARGTFLLLELEIGELWRTNIEPSEALRLGAQSAMTDGVGTADEHVIVEVRATSVGSSGSLPARVFGWVDSAGDRTAPLAVLDGTGVEIAPRISQNESLRIYLVFPGSIGEAAGAVLQVSDSDSTPENIPLGGGAESAPYPLGLDSGDVGSGTYVSVANGCTYPFDTEIRGAAVSLDRSGQGKVVRATAEKRFLTLDVALNVLSVSGPGCDWATTVYLNQWDVRLRLSNGDVLAPFYFDGRAEVGATASAAVSFEFPADVNAFEFVDGSGTVLAGWSALDLPEA